MSTTSVTDTAGEIRKGEELDIDAVHAWLATQLPGLAGRPDVTQYSGGASNWTYRLAYDSHDLILRRPPAGTKAKSAHDMGREYRIQRALKPVFPYVPAMRAFCEDPSVIGADFYVMDRVSGIIPRKNMPRGVDLDRDTVRQLCLNVLDTMVELHQVDYRAAGLEHIGKGAGYARRQIEGWNGRYIKARTWNVPQGKRIMAWLSDNIPKSEEICVIHNDFRFDNVILDADDPTKVIGVLDWELATLGDPWMDLGNTLAYWVQADDDSIARMMRRQPTHLAGMLTRDEAVAYYCKKRGVPEKNRIFYEVYGLFRLSVIAQQIYYRYYHKQTRNPAFKNLWFFIHYLQFRCRRLIGRSK